MLCLLNVAIKFLLFFKKVVTFFYKVVENGDFAYAINLVLHIIGSDVGISDDVETKLNIGMDRYFIMPDCALYIIYILSYACIVVNKERENFVEVPLQAVHQDDYDVCIVN